MRTLSLPCALFLCLIAACSTDDAPESLDSGKLPIPVSPANPPAGEADLRCPSLCERLDHCDGLDGSGADTQEACFVLCEGWGASFRKKVFQCNLGDAQTCAEVLDCWTPGRSPDSKEACDGVSCDAPPAPRCDEAVLTTYLGESTCAEGSCTYPSTTTDCAAEGKICEEGACAAAPDPCANIDLFCDTPPPDTCDGHVLTSYEDVGVCDGGACLYPSTTTDCIEIGQFCDDGACVDPCTDVICDQPPQDTCEDDLLLSYALDSGLCEGGGCVYTPTTTNCADDGGTCVDGACVGLECVTDEDCAEATPCNITKCLTGSCVVTQFPDNTPCDDGLLCTDDACEGGACVGTLKTGNCVISGNCYGTGDTPEDNPCSVCEPDQATDAWTALADGTSCEDGHDCTEDTCASGECEHLLLENTCVILGACYLEGAAKPDDTCLTCQTALAQIAWSPLSCDDGDPCTLDSCDSAGGGCTSEPDPGADPSCVDDGLCTSDLDCDDADPCTLDTCMLYSGACDYGLASSYDPYDYGVYTMSNEGDTDWYLVGANGDPYAKMNVKAGDPIVWQWTGLHNLIQVEGWDETTTPLEGGITSGEPTDGGEFAVVFDIPGVYHFNSGTDPAMHTDVQVGAADPKACDDQDTCTESDVCAVNAESVPTCIGEPTTCEP